MLGPPSGGETATAAVSRTTLDTPDNLLDLEGTYLDAAEVHAVVRPPVRTEVTVGQSLHLVAVTTQQLALEPLGRVGVILLVVIAVEHFQAQAH